MRKLVIFALFSLAVPLRAEETGFEFAFYQILSDYPNCTGPGYIAYTAAFDIALEDAIRPLGKVEAACSVTVNRGNNPEKIKLPCAGAESEAVEAEEFLYSDAFCPATVEMRPANIKLRGELIGCISIAGHEFVGGSWEATVGRPKRTTVLNGTHDDPRLELTYTSLSDKENSFFAPSISIWLELGDETLATLPDAVLGTVGFTQFLPLIDTTLPGCQSDPKACLQRGREADLYSASLQVTETARICGDTEHDSKFGTFIRRDVDQRLE